MTEIYIINSENPLNLLFKLKQLDYSRNYDILLSDDAEHILQCIQNKEDLYKERMEKEQNIEDKLWENFDNFINSKLLEPNRLSDKDIINLCHEFYNEFILSDFEMAKEYPKVPNVKIVKLGEYIHTGWTSGFQVASRDNYKTVRDDLEPFFQHNYYNTKFYYPFYNILPINYETIGGMINKSVELIYNTKFLNLEVKNNKGKNYLNWYLRSFDVLAMYYLKKDNTCYVMKKPDELKIDEDENEVYFRYGKEEFYYKNKVKLPNWLYKTKAADLKIEDFLLLQNADAKAVFIEKFGIERLVKLGIVIDSYENYPDNEMWAKSEYKIIDMHEIIPPRQLVDKWGIKRGKAKPFEYAPYLYMKNQTTGVYHLEGIHPRCKTLYDAIKMRYNGLNIKDFEIKDIK